MLPYLDTFERIITRTLLVLMAGVVLLATVELAWVLGKDVLTPRLFLLEPRFDTISRVCTALGVKLVAQVVHV